MSCPKAYRMQTYTRCESYILFRRPLLIVSPVYCQINLWATARSWTVSLRRAACGRAYHTLTSQVLHLLAQCPTWPLSMRSSRCGCCAQIPKSQLTILPRSLASNDLSSLPNLPQNLTTLRLNSNPSLVGELPPSICESDKLTSCSITGTSVQRCGPCH